MSKISNHLKKFFNGDLSLPYSYWAIGVLISFGVGFISGFLSMMLMENLALAYLVIVIWQIFPSFYTYLGAGILVSTGLYILHRETRRGTRARFPARFSRIRVSMGERKR